MEQLWINCGRSMDAVEAAVAAFRAMGGTDYVNRNSLKAAITKEDQGVSLDNRKYISWSPVSFYKVHAGWMQVGDFSSLKPAFTVNKIRLNNTYIAEIHEKETRVGCEAIPNDRILEVADRIRKNREEQQ